MNRDEAESIAFNQSLEEYWNAAYDEGSRGANEDTPGGRAQMALDAVMGAHNVAILEAVAIERQRCAELCRTLQRESRTRIELGYVCAMAIMGEGDNAR